MSRMSLDTFIKEIYNASYSSHPRKVCFFLGAGASKTSGIPSGQDLVRQWDAHLQEANPTGHLRWRAQMGITDENMTNYYSEYYDRRYRDFPTDGYADIERITAAGQPNAGYLMLAQMLTRSPHNVVITTNFDHLTEDAVDRFTDKMPLVIGHENLAEFVTGQPSRPTVIKIHRDLLLEPRSATTALLSLSEKWKPALEKIFSNYHPVFLGYAGNDKSVMDYLMANAERFKGEWKKPYWLFYGDKVTSPVVWEFLEQSEGIRIFGCGFDEVMVRLGLAFGYELPDLGKIQEREMEAFGEVRKAYQKIIFGEPVCLHSEKKPSATVDTEDEMFAAAVDVILETGQASLSTLQRRLKLGYARAFQIFGKMEEKGIIGPFAGTNSRAILVTKEQWQTMQKSTENR